MSTLLDERQDVYASALSGDSVEPATRNVSLKRSAYSVFWKPVVDRLGAGVALGLAAAPMAVVAILVLVRLGRPVIFRQRRVGLNGEVFDVLKFRTMRPDRRQRRLQVRIDRRRSHKSTADPRHTGIGRTLRRYSLDELPQLLNVVRGEMSFIGPRPELLDVVDRCYPPGLEQRHQVKPGLTGLWQVSARGSGPMHENGEWDLDYVETVSWRTDAEILLRTPTALFGSRTGS